VRKLDSPGIPGGHLPALLCIVLVAGCASGNGPKRRSGSTARPAAAAKPADPHFPNEDMAAKYQAARRTPKDFDVVMAYANTLALFCLASLVDDECGPACMTGPVRYKPASGLDADTRRLVEGALPMLDRLMSVQELSWDRIGDWAALKGRLLWLSGRAAAEQTLIDGYLLQHPDAVPVVRRRLELLREAGDTAAAEAQCNDSRASLKQAADAVRLDLLTGCVSLHPANREGRSDAMDFAKYLPKLSKDERRLYRQHLTQQCERDPPGPEAPCAGLCACEQNAADKAATAKCKEACKHCRDQAKARLKFCKQQKPQ
jgi:hypothetical protein